MDQQQGGVVAKDELEVATVVHHRDTADVVPTPIAAADDEKMDKHASSAPKPRATVRTAVQPAKAVSGRARPPVTRGSATVTKKNVTARRVEFGPRRIPNVFVLHRTNTNALSPFVADHERITLHFVCCHPQHAHLSELGYPLASATQFIATTGPYLNHVIKTLKASSLRLNDLPPGTTELMQCVEAATDAPPTEFLATSPEILGAAKREFEALVREMDGQGQMQGLTPVLTHDNRAVWMCEAHAVLARTSVSNLVAECPAPRDAVPSITLDAKQASQTQASLSAGPLVSEVPPPLLEAYNHAGESAASDNSQDAQISEATPSVATASAAQTGNNSIQSEPAAISVHEPSLCLSAAAAPEQEQDADDVVAKCERAMIAAIGTLDAVHQTILKYAAPVTSKRDLGVTRKSGNGSLAPTTVAVASANGTEHLDASTSAVVATVGDGEITDQDNASSDLDGLRWDGEERKTPSDKDSEVHTTRETQRDELQAERDRAALQASMLRNDKMLLQIQVARQERAHLQLLKKHAELESENQNLASRLQDMQQQLELQAQEHAKRWEAARAVMEAKEAHMMRQVQELTDRASRAELEAKALSDNQEIGAVGDVLATEPPPVTPPSVEFASSERGETGTTNERDSEPGIGTCTVAETPASDAQPVHGLPPALCPPSELLQDGGTDDINAQKASTSAFECSEDVLGPVFCELQLTFAAAAGDQDDTPAQEQPEIATSPPDATFLNAAMAPESEQSNASAAVDNDPVAASPLLAASPAFETQASTPSPLFSKPAPLLIDDTDPSFLFNPPLVHLDALNSPSNQSDVASPTTKTHGPATESPNNWVARVLRHLPSHSRTDSADSVGSVCSALFKSLSTDSLSDISSTASEVCLDATSPTFAQTERTLQPDAETESTKKDNDANIPNSVAEYPAPSFALETGGNAVDTTVLSFPAGPGDMDFRIEDVVDAVAAPPGILDQDFNLWQDDRKFPSQKSDSMRARGRATCLFVPRLDFPTKSPLSPGTYPDRGPAKPRSTEVLIQRRRPPVPTLAISKLREALMDAIRSNMQQATAAAETSTSTDSANATAVTEDSAPAPGEREETGASPAVLKPACDELSGGTASLFEPLALGASCCSDESNSDSYGGDVRIASATAMETVAPDLETVWPDLTVNADRSVDKEQSADMGTAVISDNADKQAPESCALFDVAADQPAVEHSARVDNDKDPVETMGETVAVIASVLPPPSVQDADADAASESEQAQQPAETLTGAADNVVSAHSEPPVLPAARKDMDIACNDRDVVSATESQVTLDAQVLGELLAACEASSANVLAPPDASDSPLVVVASGGPAVVGAPAAPEPDAYTYSDTNGYAKERPLASLSALASARGDAEERGDVAPVTIALDQECTAVDQRFKFAYECDRAASAASDTDVDIPFGQHGQDEKYADIHGSDGWDEMAMSEFHQGSERKRFVVEDVNSDDELDAVKMATPAPVLDAPAVPLLKDVAHEIGGEAETDDSDGDLEYEQTLETRETRPFAGKVWRSLQLFGAAGRAACHAVDARVMSHVSWRVRVPPQARVAKKLLSLVLPWQLICAVLIAQCLSRAASLLAVLHYCAIAWMLSGFSIEFLAAIPSMLLFQPYPAAETVFLFTMLRLTHKWRRSACRCERGRKGLEKCAPYRCKAAMDL